MKFVLTSVNQIILCLLISLPIVPLNLFAEWQSEDAAIMGTTIRVELWHEDKNIRKQAISSALGVMEDVNQLMSPYIESSQLSQVNKNAHLNPVKVNKELFDVIQRSIEVSTLSDGAFDITYASVGHLFNYRKKIKPSESELEEASAFIDFNNIEMDEDNRTISFTKPGVKIDLGGIAKGYAVDLAILKVQKLGIQHALVSAGGDTRILGDRLGRPWIVGIRDPKNPKDVIVKMPLVNEALSTSGDYERFFIEDGVRYHHIIHPATGKSAKEVRSVSIIGKDSTTTDALSTTVFVLGVEKGLKLLNSMYEIEGVIIDQQGQLFYSEGLQSLANH